MRVLLVFLMMAHLLRLHAGADDDVPLAGVRVRLGRVNILRLRLRAIRAVVLHSMSSLGPWLRICLLLVNLPKCELLTGLDRLVDEGL